MAYLALILLVGINIAPFIFFNLDIWHAQGIWAQGIIMTMFCASFFIKNQGIRILNIPLGLLSLWVGGFTLFHCFLSQVSGKYDIVHFFPYFNFLCLLIFYQMIVSHLTEDNIKLILVFMRYTVIATLFMCVLQIFNLSQFFELLSQDQYHNGMVVGFIGNGTHLSGFLAMTSPLFLARGNREDWLAIVLMFMVMFFTGTTAGDPSISGLIVLWGLMFYFSRRKIFFTLVSAVGLALLALVFGIPQNLFSTNGRLDWWGYYFELFKKMPITGPGLGTINQIYKITKFPELRHLHMEMFHYTFELGTIGAVLIINLVMSFLKTENCSELEKTLKAIVIGFLVAGVFNYNSHLWIPSTWAMFAYASFICLKNLEKIKYEY